MDTNKPSDTFLLVHRLFTFLDEWLFYGLLLYLLETGHTTALVMAVIIGIPMMIISYSRQWLMETNRYPNRSPNDQ